MIDVDRLIDLANDIGNTPRERDFYKSMVGELGALFKRNEVLEEIVSTLCNRMTELETVDYVEAPGPTTKKKTTKKPKGGEG